MDLRANTAVDVLIGPFIDKTDGNTTEDSLTLPRAEIKLSKNGQALTQKTDVTTAAFDDDGYYNCELDATDTNTEGQLVLIVHQSANALPVRHEYNVMSEAAWDSLYIAKDTGFMDVNIKTVGRADAQETEANNLESACTNYSATRGLTGTALPAVAADAAGGVPISDAGGLDLDAILVDTATTIPNLINSITSSKLLLHTPTIATLASQPSFTLTAGSPDDDAYNGCAVVVTNQTTAAKQAVGVVSNYTGSSKTIVLASDPGIMTMAAGDTIDIVAPIGSMQDAQQHSVNLVIRDTSSANIADASVYVTSDISGAVRVASGLTSDDDGIVTLNLNKGLHYRWAQKTGKNFTNPQSFTVT